MNRLDQAIEGQIPDTGWRGLYIAGGIAALFAAIVCRRFLAAEIMLTGGFGLLDVPEAAPVSAADWFALLQEDVIVGLALFEITDLVNYGLVGLIFLALYGALRRVNKSAMVVATTFAFVGIAVYFASNQAFSILSLSHRYAEVTSEGQRAMLLAAGEALLAISNPGAIPQGTGIYLSLFLIIATGLLISIVMLRSTVFSKLTAIMGILANGFALGYFVALVVEPELTWLPLSVSAPFRLLWYILIGVKLLRLGSIRVDSPLTVKAANE